MSGVLGRILPPLLVVVLVLVAWTSIVELFDIKEYLLPSPLDVVHALSEDASRLAEATLRTGRSTLLGFLIAALAVASGGDKAPPIETAAWCSNAVGLEGVQPLLEGDVDVATAESFDDARDAFYAVEVLAPFEIRSDIARLADFTFITSQAFATSDWPDAFEAAQRFGAHVIGLLLLGGSERQRRARARRRARRVSTVRGTRPPASSPSRPCSRRGANYPSLCGNQILDAPRHRRDVVPVTASARWRVDCTPSTRG